jgi:hypothetical protein
MDKERRKSARAQCPSGRELNPAQLAALGDLERFGWELKFIRRPLFQESVPVVFDPGRTHFALLTAEGTLDEHPGFDIRK